MIDDIHFLPIWVRAGETIDMDAIKAAKAALNAPFKVYPREVDQNTSGRILCVGELSPWLGDKYLVAANASQAELGDALRWVLGDGEDWQAVTLPDELQSVFGSGLREVAPEELAAEKQMFDYASGVAR